MALGAQAEEGAGSLPLQGSSTSPVPVGRGEDIWLASEALRLSDDEGALASEGARLASQLSSQEMRVLAEGSGKGRQAVRLFRPGGSGSAVNPWSQTVRARACACVCVYSGASHIRARAYARVCACVNLCMFTHSHHGGTGSARACACVHACACL